MSFFLHVIKKELRKNNNPTLSTQKDAVEKFTEVERHHKYSLAWKTHDSTFHSSVEMGKTVSLLHISNYQPILLWVTSLDMQFSSQWSLISSVEERFLKKIK